MKIQNINNKDIEVFSVMGVNAFFEDKFYENYKSKGDIGWELLKEVFLNSIKICIEYGIAKKVLVNDNNGAFLLAFDYRKLKKEQPESFDYFFYSPNFEELSILRQIRDCIENNMQTKKEYLYIPIIAVEKTFRNNGIATQLLRSVCESYSEYA